MKEYDEKKVEALVTSTKHLLNAVTYKGQSVINGVKVYEARVPIEFVDDVKRAILAWGNNEND